MITDLPTVLVAMSGGVDSSVAAAQLLEQGRRVVGVHMRLPRYGPDRDEEAGARVGADGADALAVARTLDIPLQSLDCRREFERAVVAYLCREYGRGRTPNPCVRCNDRLKFGLLSEQAAAMGAGCVATGHYARTLFQPRTGRYELRAGNGQDDQSYFLCALSQRQLARAMFPLAGWTKQEVRRLARERGLPVHDRPGSQDLCFLGGGSYRHLLRERCPEMFRPGQIVHVSGEVLGRHDGVASYTTGQRKGLGVAWREPLYVVALDAVGNRVVVGEKSLALRRELTATGLNWIAFAEPPARFRAHVRIRHRHDPAPALVTCTGEDRVRVVFDEPQMAPAPGQAAVFYDGDNVLGGGSIAGPGASLP